MTRTRRRLRAVGSAAALAALTGGLPALLYRAAGSPVPHAAPSWPQVLAALGRPENPDVLLGAVRAVSWAAWAAFTTCVLAQAPAVARGRGTGRLPGTGPLQRLAAALVTTAMIGATTAPGSAQAATSRPARVTAAAPPSLGLPPAAAVTVPGQPGAYRVRAGDNLWDIAADHLGHGEAETARRRTLDACARIAQILGPANPDEALAALEKALGHDPYNEWVYQAIMRLQAGAGRPDSVRRTLGLLEARLADLDLTPWPPRPRAATCCQGAVFHSASIGSARRPSPKGRVCCPV